MNLSLVRSERVVKGDGQRAWLYERIIQQGDPSGVPAQVERWGLDPESIPYLVKRSRTEKRRQRGQS